jgi:predicted dehydrogenase
MRAIIVGLGGRGRGWLKDCRENPDVHVVACVEPGAENRQRAISELGVAKEQLYNDLSSAIKAVKADFVVDVTPPASHESVAMTAFENGLHVLGEKPLSDDYDAARRVVKAGKQAGVKHMITQNYRFAGLPRTTNRLIKEDRVGPVGQLDVSLYVPWADLPGSHYVTQPFMFLTDMGIHHFDMMRYTLGLDPLSAQAITWNLPWGWHQGDACQLILFRFENGVVGTHRGIGCTLGHVPAGHNGEWRFEGPKGTLTWEGFDLYCTRSHRTETKVREKLNLDTERAGGPKALLVEFLTALKENRQPECNAEDNLKSMGMVFAAVKSAKEKREVSLSEL